MNMAQISNTVQRIQELDIIASELRVMGMLANPARLPIVEKSICELLESLPPELRQRYERLHGNGMAINKALDGTCQNCRMTIAKPLLQRMEDNGTEWICPNCGRFLMLTKSNK